MTVANAIQMPCLAALVWPGLLAAGAACMSIPILIHLLNKRRFRRIRWAAVDFLVEADRRNRRRVRLEELILLTLRCLAMLLIGLMLARWFLRPDALLAVLGAAGVSERIVVLDDSFSMGLATGGSQDSATVFDRSTTAIHRLIGWLREESPNDRLSVLLTSKPDTVWLAQNRIGDIQMADLESQLETLSPSNRGGNITASMTAIRESLDDREANLNVTIYVLSDFQRSDWAAGATEQQRVTGPAAALSDWADEDRTLRLVLVDVGESNATNLAITDVKSLQAQAVAGLTGRYVARVTNLGPTATKTSTLRVYVGDAAQPGVPVPVIAPYQSADVPIEVTFPNEGAETLSAELEGDALAIDDMRALAVPVQRALKVLIVNGEPSPDAFDDEAYLLSVALRPEGAAFSGNEPVIIDENELEEADLDGFHAVILANVYRLSESIVTRLETYAAHGGGIMLFLGDQVDPELYRRLLYRDGAGFLPAELTEIIRVPADQGGVGFGQMDETHPALQGFRDSEVSYFAGVRTIGYGLCRIDETATTQPLDIDSNDQLRDRAPARVLLRFADSDNHPAIIERGFGQGHVILVATSADKEWNNWPNHPAYLVVMMELVQHIARRTNGALTRRVGESIQLELDPGRDQPFVTLKLPSYPEDPAIRIDARTDRETHLPTVEWGPCDQPGTYRLETAGLSGERSARLVSVSVDPRESDLRQIDRDALIESMGSLQTEYVTVEELTAEQDVRARRELWWAVWVLLLLVLMSEQTLGWWFGTEQGVRLVQSRAK